jgi:hypothetical protein
MAMFNLEMIVPTLNKIILTSLVLRNLLWELFYKKTRFSFKFYPDPYPEQQLFYRSDNATLARLEFRTYNFDFKMDSEPNYHKASDEIGTLDMVNMTEIIKAIAISSTSIISGKDTPSRVDTALQISNNLKKASFYI